MNILRCNSYDTILENYSIIQQLYDSSFTKEKYESLIKEMIPNGYKQIAIYEEEKLVAVSGYWINTKLYTGKYLEIDNFVVDENHHGKGFGKMLIEEIEKIAKNNKANAIVLDAFSTNFSAHKFYYNHGYVPKGFHFVKFI